MPVDSGTCRSISGEGFSYLLGMRAMIASVQSGHLTAPHEDVRPLTPSGKLNGWQHRCNAGRYKEGGLPPALL